MKRRSASPRARTALCKGQVALLALMFLAGNLGTFFHAATERHARCPEHGHLIHVKGDTAPEAIEALEARLAVAESGAVIGPASPDSDDHDHDHCHLCPASRKRVLPGAGPCMPAAAATALRWDGACTHVAGTGSPLYSIAPKTSPPA
jgi:hypothetical protein